MSTKKLPTVIDYLLSKITVDEIGCFNWKGPFVFGGYGMACYAQKKSRAHRLSYETFRRPIPDGLFVCHRCDNPKCINPAHLFLGAPKDNSQDAAKKDRTIFGDRNPHTKLTPEQVREISESYNAGEETPSLMKRFGINRASVHAILKKKVWVRVERPDVKMRSKTPFGAKAHAAKHSTETVNAVLEARNSGETFASISKRLGVSSSQAHRICHGTARTEG